MKVRPCSGSAARAASSIPSQAVVNEQPGKIMADKGWATRLPRGNAQGAQAPAARIMDIDATPAPACVPDQPVRIDHRAIDAANALMTDERHGFADRQARHCIERHAIEDVGRGIGEIADLAIWREANRVRNGDVG